VQVQNGQPIMIGGLLSSEDRKNVRRIPLLSKIPLIGEFFKTTSTDYIRTELVILVTPEIVEPGLQPAAQSRMLVPEQTMPIPELSGTVPIENPAVAQ
jgi:type II secretory pathway component GspD/PulD (secretin)